MIFLYKAVIFCVGFGYLKTHEVPVATGSGTIIGHVKSFHFNGTQSNVTIFLGIPYAEPPVGDMRFRKPVKKAANSGQFYANQSMPACPQHPVYLRRLMNPSLVSQSEDCLYLNIYRPYGIDQKDNKTVMIWFYGGAFQYGFQDLYDAVAFASLNDVILVTFNYRLSIFGFLSTGDDMLPGNYGLWDQHLAIQWVSDNIKYFGGDPSKVTLFGSSAGASSGVFQSLYAGSDGLFQRVIAQSGSSNNFWAYSETPRNDFISIAKKVGCLDDAYDDDKSYRDADVSVAIDCLKNVSYSELNDVLTFTDTFNPVVDGDFVQVHPAEVFQNTSNTAWEVLKRFGKIDFIFGVNTAEGARYLLEIERSVGFTSDQLADGYTKEMFRSGIIPYSLATARMKSSELLVKEIEQEYTDWTDLKNPQKRRRGAIDFFSDILFKNGVIKSAVTHSEVAKGRNVYFYVYDHRTSVYPYGLPVGAYHNNEWIFVLGFPTALMSLMIKYNYTGDAADYLTQREIELSQEIMKYWTNFAKSGYVFP